MDHYRGNVLRTPTLHSQGNIKRPKVYLGLLRRDVAQSGSAHGWGPWGRWFKSSHPDQGEEAENVVHRATFYSFHRRIAVGMRQYKQSQGM